MTPATDRSFEQKNAKGHRPAVRAAAIEALERRVLLSGTPADIFVVDSGTGNVGEYTTAGATVNAALITSLGGPVGITGSGSNLYVVNPGDGNVNQCDTSGDILNQGFGGGFALNATGGGIAISGSNLYVTQNVPGDIGDSIAEISTDGTTVVNPLVNDNGEPLGIAANNSDIFVANNLANTIGEYTLSGAPVNPALVSVPDPLAVAVSGPDLYVVNGGDTVYEFTTSGHTVTDSLISGLNDAEGITVYGSDIFVANDFYQISGNSGTIGEYTTSGATVNADLVSGLSAPQGMFIESQSGPPVNPNPIDQSFATSTDNQVSFSFTTEQVLQTSGGQILAVGHDDTAGAGSSQGVLELLNSDGSLDTSFGPNSTGIVTTDVSANDAFYAAAFDSQGQIIAVGSSNGDFLVARYNSDGSLDTTFGNGGFATATFAADGAAAGSSVAIEPDGSIVASGQAGNVFALARFTSAGTLDTNFNPGGIDDASYPAGGQMTVPIGSVNAPGAVQQIVIDGNGDILGVGAAGASVAVFELQPSGASNPSFDSSGIVMLDQLSTTDPNSQLPVPQGIALQPGGDILVAGEDPTGGFAAVRLAPDGQIDPTFGTGGISTASFGGTSDDLTSIAADPSSGQFLLVGTSNAGGVAQVAVAAFNPDGSVNTSFATNGQYLLPAPSTLATESISPESLTRAQLSRSLRSLPQAIHPQLTDYAFVTIGASEKADVGGTGPTSSFVTQFNVIAPSSTSIGSFGKMGRRNLRLAPFSFDGTTVSISSAGGSGTAYDIGTQLELVLSGAISVTIATRGGSNSLTLASVSFQSAAGAVLHALSAPTATLAGTLSAPGAIGTLKLKNITGLVAAGAISNLAANSMSGAISCTGVLATAKLGAVSGTIAVGAIHSLTAGSLNGADILAGVNLGTDGELGSGNTYGPGQINTLSVSGSIANSFIGAGANPVDGVFGDGDDTSAGPGSAIRSISVKMGIDAATLFEAGSFPKIVHMPAKTSTAGNAQFVVLG